MQKKLILGLALLGCAGFAAFGSAQGNESPQIVMETTKGTIILELYPDKAPLTVENFLAYVESGFYDNTIFHRVIKDFMIQGGGYTTDLHRKATRGEIRNEADNGLKNLKGTIAMGRRNEPHSASAQFYINLVDNDFLDHTAKTAEGYGYCVFGKVIEGLDAVDAIGAVRTMTRGGMQDIPRENIVILSVKRR